MRIWTGLGLFIAGVVVGAMGLLLGPRYLEPYVPAFLQGPKEEIEGLVARKQQEPERLLITVSSTQGSTLAIFDEQMSEVELLLQEGDIVTLRVKEYKPFVTNPELVRVKKGEPAMGSKSSPVESHPAEGLPLPALPPQPASTEEGKP